MTEEFEKAITQGIVFKGSSKPKQEENNVKTKAKKSSYVKGTHGSGAAKQKAKYKAKRRAKSAR